MSPVASPGIILVINPGSFSTKIACYDGETELLNENIIHDHRELCAFESVADQEDYRRAEVDRVLREKGISLDMIRAIAARGGLLDPIPGGVYRVNERMLEDLRAARRGEHPSNLGAIIAAKIVSGTEIGAFIVDPVVVDEMEDVARISGHPRFKRVSIFHALNQKAIARLHAKSIDKKYEELNLVIAHLGGGISVGAHRQGRVIDVNNALDGDGPFSPERAGNVPAGQLAKLCFSGEVTYDEVKKMLTGKGGLVAHAGTNDAYEIELKARAGDAKAKLLQDAMAYNIGKAIGSMAAVLTGKVDAIILTGGIAHNPDLVDYVKEMVGFIAPVAVYPGEDEMQALAMNGLMVLKGEVMPKEYK